MTLHELGLGVPADARGRPWLMAERGTETLPPTLGLTCRVGSISRQGLLRRERERGAMTIGGGLVEKQSSVTKRWLYKDLPKKARGHCGHVYLC